MHARYLKGADARQRQVAWHFSVDDRQCVQSLPLHERGLPVEVVGLGGLLTTPEVTDVLAALHVVHDPSRGDRLMRLLTGAGVRLGPRDLVALGSWSRELHRRRTHRGERPVTGTHPDVVVLADVVDEATRAFEAHDYTRALERTEAFFWSFCDDYIELVKGRAYSDGPAADSARRALRTALDVLLRLFAPVLPFATEEVWSWWREGSVHRAPWPTASELMLAEPGDPDLLGVVASALAAVRGAKSQAKASQRTSVVSAVVSGSAADLDRVRSAEADLRAAGRVELLDLRSGVDALSVTDVVLADIAQIGPWIDAHTA